ncbi:PREDICTED: uncharacterized protein LOC108801368 [Nanorana parkeri]|uniref:uncharacterized protein LOC108801368 n=1 Tax=Nanorana parkeri TaxID=125878 RepID=UPI000854A900|nr:PREDICTED: uncharacterized protein LOC108801368 [Nanorana parkeri]
MDYKELRRKIETFSLDDGDLGNQGYERVLLQLFGYLGHGKSSFINSCKYVLDDGRAFVVYAEAGQREDGGSMTMIRKSYKLTSNITMVDNRGCKSITNFERAEVYAQLGNFHPLDKPVEWKENFKEAMSALEESELNKNTTDFLVPIFIYSAAYNLPEHEQEDVKAFLENCDKMTGVVPIVVLTKKTNGDFFDLEKRFRLMGAETVISIENYTKESNVKTLKRTTDILTIIVHALDNVTYRLGLPRDPKKDRIERKKFLLNYIHEAELRYEDPKAIKEDTNKKEKKEKKKSKGSCVVQPSSMVSSRGGEYVVQLNSIKWSKNESKPRSFPFNAAIGVIVKPFRRGKTESNRAEVLEVRTEVKTQHTTNSEMEYKELRRKIETFSLDDGDLGNQSYERVLLQLFGCTGHGKSSFINSCKYVLAGGGPFVEHAQAGEKLDGGSMTMIRKSYKLTSNILIVDNRGCATMTDFERAEVYAQLGNFHPLDQPVMWKKNFKEAMWALEESELDKNTTDFLVPIFVYSVEHILQSHEQEDVKDFFENCKNMTGVVPIVVLTHKSCEHFSKVQNQFERMGVETVIGVENYTKMSTKKTVKENTELLLGVIVHALENVTFRLSLPRDPKRERIERKKFLLNYIHEAELKNQQQTMEDSRNETGSGFPVQVTIVALEVTITDGAVHSSQWKIEITSSQ